MLSFLERRLYPVRVWGFGNVTWLFAISALAGTVSCSGTGSESVPGTTPGGPALPSSSIVSNGTLAARSETTAAVTPVAILTSSADVDAADIAALEVPLTSDVAPVGDATASIEYNWNLSGNYSGLIKQWQDGVEQKGTISFSIFNAPPKPFFGGNGTIVIGGSSSNVLMQGRIVKTYEHSVALIFSLTFGPGETCSATGTARRYRHVFEGVLKSLPGSSGCASSTNNTTYFKVNPAT